MSLNSKSNKSNKVLKERQIESICKDILEKNANEKGKIKRKGATIIDYFSRNNLALVSPLNNSNNTTNSVKQTNEVTNNTNNKPVNSGSISACTSAVETKSRKQLKSRKSILVGGKDKQNSSNEQPQSSEFATDDSSVNTSNTNRSETNEFIDQNEQYRIGGNCFSHFSTIHLSP
jgi:hypothetical protein